MREIPGLADVKSSTEGGNPEIQIRFDRDRLAAMGLDLNSVAEMVRAKVQGEIATDITREDRTVDIRLRSEERYRDSVRDLRNLNVNGGATTAIPLQTVAEVVETTGPAEIRRSDGSRNALITANLVGDRDLGSVSKDIEAVLQRLEMPLGFDWKLGGQRQEMKTSFDSMRLAALLAVFMVYLVMASQFESLLHPFVILFSVPFAAIGVLATLWAFGVTISVVVMIGVIMLAGIVVNNGILLIDYTNQLRQQGMAEEGSADRGRPGAAAPDPDDHRDHRARPAADGVRAGRGQRAAHADGAHRDRWAVDVDAADAAGDPRRLLRARPSSVGAAGRLSRAPLTGERRAHLRGWPTMARSHVSSPG